MRVLWRGDGQDDSRLGSDTAVMELIDHLYGRLLAPLAVAYNKITPNPRLCVTATIAEPIHKDQPSPIDFILATILTLAAGFTRAPLRRLARHVSVFLQDGEVQTNSTSLMK